MGIPEDSWKINHKNLLEFHINFESYSSPHIFFWGGGYNIILSILVTMIESVPKSIHIMNLFFFVKR